MNEPNTKGSTIGMNVKCPYKNLVHTRVFVSCTYYQCGSMYVVIHGCGPEGFDRTTYYTTVRSYIHHCTEDMHVMHAHTKTRVQVAIASTLFYDNKSTGLVVSESQV